MFFNEFSTYDLELRASCYATQAIGKLDEKIISYRKNVCKKHEI